MIDNFLQPFLQSIHSVLYQPLRPINHLNFALLQEECKSFAINYSDLLDLYNQSQILERIGRIMAERQFVIEYELRRMFINMDSFERYS